jgi:hypothetical protein
VPPDALGLRIHHDEDAEVYLNGQLIAKRGGHTSGYVLAACQGDVAGLLNEGKNQLAVHCRQTRGGQFIDVGVVAITPPSSSGER